MSDSLPKLAPISDQLHEAIDRERQEAYSNGASAVWQSLGCPSGITSDPMNATMPNQAVYDDYTGFYVVRPKDGRPVTVVET